jgi:hypothetical protein
MASQEDIALMAHLMRRAGFGASRAEIEAQAAQGYNATVEALLNPATQPALEEDLMLRYNPVYNHSANIQTNVQQWVYSMINNPLTPGEDEPLLAHDLLRWAQQNRQRRGNEPHDRYVPRAWHGQFREPAHEALHLCWYDVLSGQYGKPQGRPQ